MKLQELKKWINELPEDFLEFQIVHAEVIRTDNDELADESYTIRLDKPITALTVDQETNEILIMNDYEGSLDDLEFDEDPNDGKEFGTKE